MNRARTSRWFAGLGWVTNEARCFGLPDEVIDDAFFPEAAGKLGGLPESRYDDARKICNECPLKLPCRRYALTHNVDGFWGGLSPQKRRAMRKKAA